MTLPYVEAIADHGLAEAVARDRALARGVNVLDGKLTYEAVAEAHGLEYQPLEEVLPLVAGREPGGFDFAGRDAYDEPGRRGGDAITHAMKSTMPNSPRTTSIAALE